MFDRVSALELEEGRFGKEYYSEGDETEDDFHAFEYLLS